MSKLRVHELARELGRQNREVIEFLKSKGVDVRSHMSMVDEPAVSEVKNRFRKDNNNRGKELNGMATDEELYGQYLSGDETGLELLIKKYGDPLTLYIDGYLHDVHEAEDLMMETFSWLFTKKPRIRDGCFKAYLYKAARHMALRHKSRRRIIFSLDDLTREPEAQTLVEEVVRTKERNQILHLCMDELNPDYREALYLTYFEGMSYQQAAEVMGKSVKQITNMVYRGKERLRGLLQREGITDVEK